MLSLDPSLPLLINLIKSRCQETAFSLPLTPLSKANPGRGALAFDCAGAQIALHPLDDKFLQNFAVLDEYRDLTLPDDLYLGFFETLLGGAFEKIASLAGAEFADRSYTGFDKLSEYACSLDVMVHAGDDLPLKEDLNLRVFIKDEDSVEALCRLFENLLPAAEPQNALQADANLQLCLGRSRLSIEELKSLRVLDAVVIDEYFLKEKTVIVTFKQMEAKARLEQDRLVLAQDFAKVQGDLTRMSEPDSITEETYEEAGLAPLTPLSQVNLNLSFNLKGQPVTLEDAASLKEGSIINLAETGLDDVAVCIEGQCIARGRVISVGTQYAVQITRLDHAV